MKSINEKVDWKVFLLTITIVVTTFGFVWSAIKELTEKHSNLNREVGIIGQDVSWIRKQIEGRESVSSGNLLNRMYSHE